MLLIRLIIIFILSIKLIDGNQVANFCFKTESECHGDYDLNCDNNICAKNRNSCEKLMLYRSIKNLYKYEKDFFSYVKPFELFISQIKDCLKYKWNQNDVCLNQSKNCFKTVGFGGRWSILIKSNECKCSGKYKHDCNNSYCASDKRACEILQKNMTKSIKKCTSFE
jgi:hypothetical protein